MAKDMKKILFFSILVLSIVIANSIIYLVAPIENKIIYTNCILLINSSIACWTIHIIGNKVFETQNFRSSY